MKHGEDKFTALGNEVVDLCKKHGLIELGDAMIVLNAALAIALATGSPNRAEVKANAKKLGHTLRIAALAEFDRRRGLRA